MPKQECAAFNPERFTFPGKLASSAMPMGHARYCGVGLYQLHPRRGEAWVPAAAGRRTSPYWRECRVPTPDSCAFITRAVQAPCCPG